MGVERTGETCFLGRGESRSAYVSENRWQMHWKRSDLQTQMVAGEALVVVLTTKPVTGTDWNEYYRWSVEITGDGESGTHILGPEAVERATGIK